MPEKKDPPVIPGTPEPVHPNIENPGEPEVHPVPEQPEIAPDRSQPEIQLPPRHTTK